MKGSVRKRYNNAWSYRIDLGFVDGKRKQVEKGGFKTEREATKAMQDVLYHLNNTGDYVENKKISFHTVYEEFIEREGKATRAYATLKKYDSLYRNHIKDEFGPLYVYQISDTMIIDFLNQKRIKYSEEYVKGVARTLGLDEQETEEVRMLFGVKTHELSENEKQSRRLVEAALEERYHTIQEIQRSGYQITDKDLALMRESGVQPKTLIAVQKIFGLEKPGKTLGDVKLASTPKPSHLKENTRAIGNTVSRAFNDL